MTKTNKIVVLSCMSHSFDGAHCGLGDWYPEIEKGIKAALRKGAKYHWTTGWYSSKKECASCRITNDDNGLSIQVSVTDDFDTEGYGEVGLPWTKDLELVREAIYKAWDEASNDQKDNQTYLGFSILTPRKTYPVYIGGKGKGKARIVPCWVETYIQPVNPLVNTDLDSPPGDNYQKWGWQGDHAVPKKIRQKMEKWIANPQGEKYTVGKWTIKPWE